MLSERHQRFVDEYLKDHNATRAAWRAGYAAGTRGGRLLRHPAIRAAVDAALLDQAQKEGITGPWVLAQLREVAQRCLQVAPVRDQAGNAGQKSRFDAPGALRALELLGKHLGLFDEKPRKEADNVTIHVIKQQ